MTEVFAGKYYYTQSKWLKFLLDDITTAKASDWGFCWRIVLLQEQVTEVSTGLYSYSQSKWLMFLVNNISQQRQEKNVMLKENFKTRENDWCFWWRILVQYMHLNEVSAQWYIFSQRKWLMFLLEDKLKKKKQIYLLEDLY